MNEATGKKDKESENSAEEKEREEEHTDEKEKLKKETEGNTKKIIQADLDVNYELPEKNSLDASEVIKRSAVVEGIFLTKERKCWELSRSPIVDVVGDIYFKAPCEPVTYHCEEFFTLEEKCDFDIAVSKRGYNFAAKAFIPPIAGEGVDAGYKNENQKGRMKDKNKSSSNSTFIKTIYSIIPVAQWEPTMQNIVLAHDPKVGLKNISDLLSKRATEQAKSLALTFFDKFGSHFYLGKTHFGGIFKNVTTCETSILTNASHNTDVVYSRHALGISAVFPFAYAGGEVSGHYGKRSKATENVVENEGNISVTTNVVNHGGPIGVDSIQLWQKGLIENNRTWKIVSSGEPEICQGKLQIKDYIGVWELVLNEATCFGEHALQLAIFLLDTYTNKTGFENDTSSIDRFRIQESENKFREFTKTIQCQMKPSLFAAILKNLHDKVVELKQVPGCNNVWETELCKDEVISCLFKTITETVLDESLDVRYHMEALLKLTKVQTFPFKEEIQDWLDWPTRLTGIKPIISQRIQSVEQFLGCFNEQYLCQKRLYLDKCKSEKEKECKAFQNITKEVAVAIIKLLRCLKEENKHTLYVFFLSLILQIDFDIKLYKITSILKMAQLVNFLSCSRDSLEQYNQLQKQESVALEAFAFYQLVKAIVKKNNNIKEEAQSLYDEVQQHIKDKIANFQPQIKDSLEGSISGTFRNLQNIIERGDKDNQPIIMWNFFEKQPAFRPEEISYKRNRDTLSNLSNENPVLYILEQIGLKKYYPGKLTNGNVYSLLDDVTSLYPKKGDIPWIMLRGIMSTDFNYREQVLEDCINSLANNSKEDLKNDYEDDDDLFAAGVCRDNQTQCQVENLNPTDIFLALFMCCDPFLKQMIVHKISVCQLAVPYFYTNFYENRIILSLFPLREVFYDCRSQCVASAPLKTVSFIKLGSGLTKSKSKIINELLRKNNEEHSTFFHRDCPRGMTKRTISNGLVEASWYVPRQDTIPRDQAVSDDQTVPKQQITEPITVLNLRGDATEFEEQIDKLIIVSNIITIFIKYEDLKNRKYNRILMKIHKSSCSVILLTDATDADTTGDKFIELYKKEIDIQKTKLMSTFGRKQRRETNAGELKSRLKRNIILLLKTIEQGSILENVAVDNHILTDESNFCSSIQHKAKLLYKPIHDSTELRKQSFTPLQCEDLWQKWSVKQKERKRQTCRAQYEETFLSDMEALREKQVDKCNQMPDTVAKFVQIMLDFVDHPVAMNYFLFFFRQQLDNDSKITIVPEYFRLAFENYEHDERQQLKSSEIKTYIDGLDNQLARASFGLEHFFREIGQIYESFVYCKDELGYVISDKTECIIQKLPLVVAQVILLCQPLELMDGDAVNVPLIWIKAVFDHLKQILGENKLLTLSVLGIQSSGKSTLLNTMFGLRFPVSAGRCTRGLFAQIIPIDKTNSSFNFDYAMVIDTEGLRTPELSFGKKNHDNELATFVIGLADIVLINIKGETIADMENVLQIVVYGLLRLKQANKNLHLRQRCIFVHQNVSAEDARSRMLQGNRNTIERLDKTTKEVASQEGIPEISCFKEVIDFDPIKDVRFLPDRWNGTPPMAPASTTYSSKAVDIRRSVLEYGSSKKIVCTTIEEKMVNLDRLWNGILNENFVFSFCNCLEVKAYSLLESKFQSLLSTLDSDKLQWIDENIESNMFERKTTEQLHQGDDTLNNDFRTKIKTRGSKLKEEIETFINQSELSEVMIKWKANKLQYLDLVTNTMVQEIEQIIGHKKRQRMLSLSYNDCIAKRTSQMMRKVKEVTRSFKKRQLTQDVITEQFQELWVTMNNELIPEFTETKMESKNRNLEEDIKQVLHEKFRDHYALIKNSFEMQPLTTPILVENFKHCMIDVLDTYIVNLGKHEVGNDQRIPKQPMIDTINDIVVNIDEKFELFLQKDTGYDISQLRQVIEKVRTSFNTFNDNNKMGCTLTPKLEVSIAVHVARISYQKFMALNLGYEKNHSIQHKLLIYKPEAQQLFSDLCQTTSQEMIATNVICITLQEFIKERIHRDLTRKVQLEMLSMYPTPRKTNIMKEVLSELANKDDFETFMEYIRDPDQYVKHWIKQKTIVTFFPKHETQKSKYQHWVKNDVELLIKHLKSAVIFASQKCSNK